MVSGAKLPNMKLTFSSDIYVPYYISNTSSRLLVFIAPVKNIPRSVYGCNNLYTKLSQRIISVLLYILKRYLSYMKLEKRRYIIVYKNRVLIFLYVCLLFVYILKLCIACPRMLGIISYLVRSPSLNNFEWVYMYM